MAVKGIADSVIQQITKVRSKADLVKQLDTDWLFQGRWLRAGRIHYIAPDGVKRVWETTERTTRTAEVDGVDIIGWLLEHSTFIIISFKSYNCK